MVFPIPRVVLARSVPVSSATPLPRSLGMGWCRRLTLLNLLEFDPFLLFSVPLPFVLLGLFSLGWPCAVPLLGIRSFLAPGPGPGPGLGRGRGGLVRGLLCLRMDCSHRLGIDSLLSP